MHLKWVWVALALFLSAPAAGASEHPAGFYNPVEPVDVTMYLHVNGIQDMPINTQRPDDRYASSPAVGLVRHSQGCIDVPNNGLAEGARHTWYGHSSPGYVDYEIDLGGKPRIHPERGISYDIDFDTSKPVQFTWFLETQWLSGNGDPDVNSVPVVLPQVVLRATIREGDQISPDHEAMNTGKLVAQMTTEPVLLAGPQTDHPQVTYHALDNGRHLYEFSLDMPLETDTIRKDEAFNVRVDAFQANDVCQDPDAGKYVMADWVRLHTSPAYRPQFTWTITNPVVINVLHPMFLGDDLVVHAAANSVWGNYDIRGDYTDGGEPPRLVVTGPSVPVGMELAAFNSPHKGHDAHTEDVQIAWVWPYFAENAKPGVYRIEMTVQNDQENAVALAVGGFAIGADGRGTDITGCGFQVAGECATETTEHDGGVSKPTPGAGLLFAVAGVGIALRARRR